MIKLIVALLLAAAVALPTPALAEHNKKSRDPGKVTICHYDDNDTEATDDDEFVTIRVSTRAWNNGKGHAKHTLDHEGECTGDEEIPT